MASDVNNSAAMVFLAIVLIAIVGMFVYSSATNFSQSTFNTPNETDSRW